MTDEKFTVTLTVRQARLLLDAAQFCELGLDEQDPTYADDVEELLYARIAIRCGLRDANLVERI